MTSLKTRSYRILDENGRSEGWLVIKETRKQFIFNQRWRYYSGHVDKIDKDDPVYGPFTWKDVDQWVNEFAYDNDVLLN